MNATWNDNAALVKSCKLLHKSEQSVDSFVFHDFHEEFETNNYLQDNFKKTATHNAKAAAVILAKQIKSWKKK